MSSDLIGSFLIHLAEIDSTNAYAQQMLKESRPPEGTLIRADFQRMGKGMDTNSWESDRGENLLFSIILYPLFLAIDEQFKLNQAISLGITDMVSKLLPQSRITIKWPNDVYVGDNKICGILIQHSILGRSFDFSVVGIGLNVNQMNFHSPAPNPVSLKLVSGTTYELEDVLNQFCNSLNNRYQQLKNGMDKIINRDYLNTLYRKDQWHNFSIRGNSLSGRITGISIYGQLLVESSEGIEYECDVKEIQYLS